MLYLDLETYSECDLRKAGGYAYAAHPTTEIMLLAYAIDDGPAKVWDWTADDSRPVDLMTALEEAASGWGLVCAHNSMFDRVVLEHKGFRLPVEAWRDTMVQALSIGLPASLDTLGEVLGLPPDAAKLKDGPRLINRFCSPAPSNHKATRYTRETHPAEWARFIEYARRDVEAMRLVHSFMPDRNMRGEELALWHLDQKINDRGLPIDLDLVAAAQRLVEAERARLNTEMAVATFGAVRTTTATAALTAWVRAQGVEAHSLAAPALADLLAGNLPPEVRRALTIRAEASKSSVAKYDALEAAAVGGRIRGTLQFCGASRTGRWGGRLFQPQNLPRPTVDIETGCDAILNGTVGVLFESPMEVASSCVRGAIRASAGHTLIVSDLAGIEGRVLPWLCGFQKKIDAIAQGLDMYKVAASGIYGVDYDEVTKAQRTVGKVAELALGFQGGAAALQSMARNYRVEFADAVAQETVAAWRETNGPIRSFWYDLQRAAIEAVEVPGVPLTVGRVQVMFDRVRDTLAIMLPSGRALCYFRPRVEEQETAWGLSNVLTFIGTDQVTRRTGRLDTYGGKLVENVTQAVARDVLAAAMPAVEAAGFRIVGTVHDEIITEAPLSAGLTHHQLSALLATPPAWADGLPLAAEGYTSARYQK